MIMISEFRNFLTENDWDPEKNRFLAAVSGGMDSVCLVRLLAASGCSFGIAHINFQLRGKESDEDARFVESLAAKLGVPFHETSIDTRVLAEEGGNSIQEAARNFRYAWLEDVRHREKYDLIATAHHVDDSLETLLLNLAKGTGIRGLAGIPLQRQRIVRPLLFTNREAIEGFIQEQNQEYREDRSNQDLKYERNRIRHEVLPVLRTLNPSLSEAAVRTFAHLRDNLAIYQFTLNNFRQELLQKEKTELRLSLAKLHTLPAPQTVLYEMLATFGVNPDQGAQLWEAIGREHSGKIFPTPGYDILLDRKEILIRPRHDPHELRYEVHADETFYLLPEGRLEIHRHISPPLHFSGDANEAWIDERLLEFPLILRRWQPGDYFHPLGMDGHRKKVQDLFTDRKLNKFAKESVWILENNGQIAWIVGHQLDENHKIVSETQSCLHFRYFPNK